MFVLNSAYFPGACAVGVLVVWTDKFWTGNPHGPLQLWKDDEIYTLCTLVDVSTESINWP